MTTKLPNKKYVRVHPDQFKEWITEVMKEPRMRYATPTNVADEIALKYGGVATSHLTKIRRMRLDVQNFLPKEELKRREQMPK